MTPSNSPLCPECGQPDGECYRICPTQDPYHGDQAAENADYEFNAQYDDVRERYAGDIDPDYEMFCADQADAQLARDGMCEACGEPREDDPDFCPACLADMASKRAAIDDNDIPF